MPRVWKLIAYITPMGSGVPLREHFLVAIDDRDQAIKASGFTGGWAML
jgi:hypothetical protein